MGFYHKSVLLNESIQGLNIKKDGVYIDGTAGGGGHSEKILNKLKTGKLILIDQDPDAIDHLKKKFHGCSNVIIVNDNFSNIKHISLGLGISGIVDGILLDLGVSSYQLDVAQRGFSYKYDGLIDMRMSKTGISAYDIINSYSEEQISKILYSYAEEPYSRRIARRIVEKRNEGEIKFTSELAEIIKSAIPVSVCRKSKHHPAKKSFQALRIAVNGELDVLNECLDDSISVLKKGGRLAVITFHSLEDRIVKRKINNFSKGCECPSDFPVCVCNKLPVVTVLNKKPILPSESEIQENPRSRSAKLRICEKI